MTKRIEGEVSPLDSFFSKMRRLAPLLKAEPNQTITDQSTLDNNNIWRIYISTMHLGLIYEWIYTHEEFVRNSIEKSSRKIARFDKTDESTKRNLYLTFFISKIGNLYLNTNSKRANHQGNERLKEPEVKSRQRKTKVIGQSSDKLVKLGLVLFVTHDDPVPCAIGVIKEPDAIERAVKEEKYSQLIGNYFANKIILTDPYLRDQSTAVNTLSRLGEGDMVYWSENYANQMDFVDFLLVLYKIVSAVAFMHSLKIIWRDLKPDNILFLNYESPILIDFSLASSTYDHTKELRNDRGSLPYISPESSFFLNLRTIKIELIKSTKEFKKLNKRIDYLKKNNRKLPKELLKTQRSIKKKLIKLRTEFDLAKENIRGVVSGNSSYSDDCDLAIKVIEKVTNENDLIPKNYSKTKSLDFLASQADDVWALSKLIWQILDSKIETYEDKNGSLHPLSEVNQNRYEVLKSIHNYFKENLFLTRNKRETSPKIKSEIENLFKTLFKKFEKVNQTVQEIKGQEQTQMNNLQFQIRLFKSLNPGQLENRNPEDKKATSKQLDKSLTTKENIDPRQIENRKFEEEKGKTTKPLNESITVRTSRIR